MTKCVPESCAEAVKAAEINRRFSKWTQGIDCRSSTPKHQQQQIHLKRPVRDMKT